MKIKYNLSLVSKTEHSSRTKLLSCVRCVTSWLRIDCQSLIHFICDMMSSFLFLNIHLHECEELFNIIFFPPPPMEKSVRKVPFLERFPMRIYFIETKSEKQNRQTGTWGTLFRTEFEPGILGFHSCRSTGSPSSRLEKKPTINSWTRHALCDSVLSYERNLWKFEHVIRNSMGNKIWSIHNDKYFEIWIFYT